MASDKTLSSNIKSTPAIFDPAAATQMREVFGARIGDFNADTRALLDGVASCSPYLRRLLLRDPDHVVNILNLPLKTSLARACNDALGVCEIEGGASQMKALRRAKDQAALSIALGDIAGAWGVMEAAQAVSTFADAAVRGALKAAALLTPYDLSEEGLTVLAMGKHGAEELNYSSDIDLIILFDRVAMGAVEAGQAQKAAVKVSRELVNLLHMQTADGYVFRTDLRLRPDPGVSPIALSVQAAETYYEAYGQNWERMAFIKARAAAGDLELGKKFIAALRPFVWRKYLDFAAIEDVYGIKRQIHAAKGGADIEFAGHDIKLGRGGIREIEFYAQTQQLILGGKNPALRQRATLDALDALCTQGHISAEAANQLSGAYKYLRQVEHRLQMINDEQTHKIPKNQNDIERLAFFLGERNSSDLQDRLEQTLKTVKHHFAGLFESSNSPPSGIGPMVFTGVEDQPATLDTLQQLGFTRGAEISETIRRWKAGGMRATRSARARSLLSTLIAPLLEALSSAGNPDDAFFAFADFLERLPAGVQVFSLLANNLSVFEALSRIMTISPYLGRELSRRVNFVERLLESNWSVPPPDIDVYPGSLRETLDSAHSYEEVLNIVRRWVGEQKFLVTAQLAAGMLAPCTAAAHFTAIADASITSLAPAVTAEMERYHGPIAGDLTIVGLGRLGAGEMTASSDIDLMFVYDAPVDASSSGVRSLSAIEYYTRLVRRFVTALSAATEEGALYEVDMALRPSGGAGPAAVSLSAFQRYYEQDAWTWEVMALTKARCIGAPDHLANKIQQEVDKILRRHRDCKSVAHDVNNMRLRLADEKPAAGRWDVKNLEGGLTDISFICQYLALISSDRFGASPRAATDAIRWFAENDELAQEDAAVLEKAHSIFDAVLHVSRAATAGVFKPGDAGEALKIRMASICGETTIAAAEQALVSQRSLVARVYRKVLGNFRDTNAHNANENKYS